MNDSLNFPLHHHPFSVLSKAMWIARLSIRELLSVLHDGQLLLEFLLTRLLGVSVEVMCTVFEGKINSSCAQHQLNL